MKKNIVTIGGGTGSFTILSGLRKYEDFNISAIVSMADDGGSTGRLRDELGVLPPGDIRQCLVALSNEPQVIRELFNYRFEKGDLKGHTVGNIILSALEKSKGNFSKGLKVAESIFNIEGEVIPVTNDNINLSMKLKNGVVLEGEGEINKNLTVQKKGIEKIFLKPNAKLNPAARKAIKEANVVVIGPGNHYCSIIPNLLVSGLAREIKNSKAKIVYVANLVNKKGHLEGFDLDDYIKSINSYIGKDRVDYVIYNSQRPSLSLVKKYEERGEGVIIFDEEKNSNRKHKTVYANLLGKILKYSKADAVSDTRSFMRHDSDKLAKIIKYIGETGDYNGLIKRIS